MNKTTIPAKNIPVRIATLPCAGLIGSKPTIWVGGAIMSQKPMMARITRATMPSNFFLLFLLANSAGSISPLPPVLDTFLQGLFVQSFFDIEKVSSTAYLKILLKNNELI